MEKIIIKDERSKEEKLEGDAIDWFAEVYQSDEISIYGGYFGGYEIYDNKLFLARNDNPDRKGAGIEIFEIPSIIKLYKKYKKYTHNIGYVSFKHEYDWEHEQFLNEL